MIQWISYMYTPDILWLACTMTTKVSQHTKIGMSHINSEFLTSILKSRWYGDIGPLFLLYSLGLNSSCSLWEQSDDSDPRSSPPDLYLSASFIYVTCLTPMDVCVFPLTKINESTGTKRKLPISTESYWSYMGVKELDSPWFKPRTVFFMAPGV